MIFASMLMSLFLGLAQAEPPSNPSPSPNKSTDNSKSEDPYRDLESFKKHVAKLEAAWDVTGKRARQTGKRVIRMKIRGIEPAWKGKIPGIDSKEASRVNNEYDDMFDKYNLEYRLGSYSVNAFASKSLKALEEKGSVSPSREDVDKVKQNIPKADSGYQRFLAAHKRGAYDDMWNRYERFLNQALDYLGRKEGLKREEVEAQKRDGGREAYIRSIEADFDNFKAYRAVAEAFIEYAERKGLVLATKPKE